MATIDSKDIVDNIIANDGWYSGDKSEPRALKVVEYTNAWDKQTYGVVFEGERGLDRYEDGSGACFNPEVIWRAS